MIRSRTSRRWSLLLPLAVIGIAGCRAAAPATRPVVATQQDSRPGEALHQTPTPAPPRFDQGQETEPVPYENRLLANMTRHTFTSVGRDFDPDPDPTGQTIAFASTRNSERPDIFVKSVEGFAITQLTSDPADDVQPRFSPDGQKLVFCSNRTGNWDIWTVNLDGTGLTQLTHDRADEIAPCWAPDGTRVAFSLWGRQSHQWEIWVVSVDRPAARRFLCYGMFPDWSPDGRRIAFQRARQRGTRWFSIWTVELVGDEARYPTEVAYDDTASCIAPRWSPDGRIIVYCTARPDGQQLQNTGHTATDVWLVDAQAAARTKVTDGAVDAFNPVWASDDRIFFVSARAGTENIWSLRTHPLAHAATPPNAGAATVDPGLGAVPNVEGK